MTEVMKKIEYAFPFDISNYTQAAPLVISECLGAISESGVLETTSKFDGVDYDKENHILRIKFYHWEDSDGNIFENEDGFVEKNYSKGESITKKYFLNVDGSPLGSI